MGKTYGLQKELLKKEMDQDEVFVENWMGKKHECLDYVKNDVLCTAFYYASAGKIYWFWNEK